MFTNLGSSAEAIVALIEPLQGTPRSRSASLGT
jgi:hypothetical protein